MGTTESAPLLFTPQIWTSTRSKETLLMVPQFTPPESVLVAPSMDLDFLLVSPRNSVLELRRSCPMLSRPSLVNLLENTIHSQECKSLFANNWLMITSCLCLEREWPEGRGIFHNDNKTFLIWINEEDQLRIISM